MKRTRLSLRQNGAVVTLLAGFILILIGLYAVVIRTSTATRHELINLAIEDPIAQGRMTADRLAAAAGLTPLARQINADPRFRNDAAAALSRLLTPGIKYAYLLARDDRQRLRYLLDVSPMPDRAESGQIFAVPDPRWQKPFRDGRPLVFEETGNDAVGVTWLYPIMQQGEITALLVLDFTIKKIAAVDRSVYVMKLTIFALILLLSVILIVLVVQAVRYGYLKRRTYTDPLTGIHNRAYLDDLEHFLHLNRFILILIDLDRFKKINDTYGHDIGDLTLREAATRIASVLRRHDHLIRYGGEEFLLLASCDGDTAPVLHLCDRISSAVSTVPITISPRESLTLTISMGVNLTTGKERSLESAIKHADIALYQAKHKGRNRIELYDEQPAPDDFMTTAAIKTALDEKRIVCHFQPIIDLATGKVIHYETLVRIRQGDELILPGRFLPVIEGTFIYSRLSRKVLGIVLELLRRQPSICISINLATSDILNPDIFTLLSNLSGDVSLPPRLCIEILESEAVTDLSHFSQAVATLKALGYPIAIDDFGSGYANFVNLSELSIDYLKIDGSLIKKIDTDTGTYAIVKAIQTFADELGIMTVAEYVSSAPIDAVLRTLGVRCGQGNFYADAGAIDTFIADEAVP